MDFALTELQQEIAALAGGILGDACTPAQLQALEASGPRLDPTLWQSLREAGLAAVAVSEAAGGAGLGLLEAGLVIERLGATVAPLPLIGHVVAAMALERTLGAEALAPLLASPGWLACSLRTEGNTLVLADGRLNGELSGIAYGAGCLRALVPAREGRDWVLCLVNGADAALNWRSQTSTALEPQALLEARGAAAQKLGGGELLAWVGRRLTTAVAMAQVGVLDAALQLARQHVCEREQFGVRIGSFQAVAHRMADCWIDLMNLRLAALAAAASLDQGREVELEVRSAEVWAAEAGHRVLASCQHVHGGLGHDRDYPLWRYAVWARHYEMIGGGVGLALERLGSAIAADPEAAFL